MSHSLEHFIKELDDLDCSRQYVAVAALEWLSTSDPELVKVIYDVFKTPEKASSWLSKEVHALGGEMPLRLLQDDRESVLDCLNRIKYGMFA